MALLHHQNHQNPQVTDGPRLKGLPKNPWAKAPTARRPTWNVQIRRSRCPRGFYRGLPCWYCPPRSGSRPGIHRCPTKLCSRIHLMIILLPIKITIKRIYSILKHTQAFLCWFISPSCPLFYALSDFYQFYTHHGYPVTWVKSARIHSILQIYPRKLVSISLTVLYVNWSYPPHWQFDNWMILDVHPR